MAREVGVVRRADEVFAERTRPVLGVWIGQREREVGGRGEVCGELAEGD